MSNMHVRKHTDDCKESMIRYDENKEARTIIFISIKVSINFAFTNPDFCVFKRWINTQVTNKH